MRVLEKVKKSEDEEEQERIDAQNLRIRFSNEIQPINSLFDILYICLCQKYDVPSKTIDVNTGKTQCSSGRRRSLEDIYLVARNYIPSVTYAQIRNISELLIRNQMVLFGYCNVVKRYVHRAFSFKSRVTFTEFLVNNKILDIAIDESLKATNTSVNFSSFDSYEKYYKRYGGLCFISEDIHKSIKTLNDVIYWGLMVRKATFGVKLNRPRIKEGHARTFNDIYRLAKYYIPEVTFDIVASAFELLQNNDIIYSQIDWYERVTYYVRTYVTKEDFDKLSLKYQIEKKEVLEKA